MSNLLFEFLFYFITLKRLKRSIKLLKLIFKKIIKIKNSNLLTLVNFYYLVVSQSILFLPFDELYN